NDFDIAERWTALEELAALTHQGLVILPETGDCINLHCHSFFSYNGYGYSPTCLAWRGRAAGLYAMGLVDFDVLDGVDEFLEACAFLGMRACAGIETRVFVPEFAGRTINSPGEPGISYHMGVGFTSGEVADDAPLAAFKRTAQERTRELAARVSAYLDPAGIDFERDVLPLTPNWNATERHVCMALDERARTLFPKSWDRARFWAEKLDEPVDLVAAVLDHPPKLQGLIRAKTMKAGGVGYVKPESGDFPQLRDVSAFVLANDAIPAFAFLDGTTDGEQAMKELLDVMMESGVAAVNIIPDRNWNFPDPEVRRRKGKLLHEFVEESQSRGLPIIAGTEMNAHGQRFVDDFNAPELAPLLPVFLEGADIVYAHTRLQREAGIGYLSDWARRSFPDTRAKNAFYAELGRRLAPGDPEGLNHVTSTSTPDEILAQWAE
ncbi:MAG: hypothetical protein KA184_22000, partial [Candidatus Hydrogenedentes bacterium]|nr:hypothetical protein [Candidatus Hydrogenedentota bacterium]